MRYLLPLCYNSTSEYPAPGLLMSPRDPASQVTTGVPSPATPSTTPTVTTAPHSSSTAPSDASPAVRTSRSHARALAAAKAVIRGLSSALVERGAYADRTGRTFEGRRDLYRALGYKRILTLADYRKRYERGGIAKTIVEAYPLACWSGGVDLIEDEDPKIITTFEQAIINLDIRLQLWSRVLRAIILAGLGRYSILLINTPLSTADELSTPLIKISNPDNIFNLTPLPEEQAKIISFNDDITNPRFTLPEYYELQLGSIARTATGTTRPKSKWYRVHESRIIHIAKGLLSDDIYGQPELEPCWNDLDDIDKVKGGGAEAAWTRAEPGIHIDIDPDIDMSKEEEDELEAQIEEYRHGYSRELQTQGGKINLLSSSVSNYGPNLDASIKLVSATKRIPHRILVGSERGELSSTQDRDNWKDRVHENRQLSDEPIARRVTDRLVALGVLPQPEQYEVSWPDPEDINAKDKAGIALVYAQANKYNTDAGTGLIKTGDEIRDELFGDEPLSSNQQPATTSSDTSGNTNNTDNIPSNLPITVNRRVTKAAVLRAARLSRRMVTLT